MARVFALALLGTGLTHPAQAHELGTAQVLIELDRDAMRVVIPVDPDVLLLRLDALAGRPLIDAANAEERNRRLALAANEFAAACRIAVDGRPAAIAVEYQPPTSGASGSEETAPAFMRLHARLPEDVSSLTWSYGLVYGSYPLVVHAPDGSSRTEWIVGSAESRPILRHTIAPPSRAAIAIEYLWLGFTHILPRGLDHMLFVLGIFFLSPRLRSVFVQVSSFTLAHSITLAMTMNGLVSLSPSIVEPLIALSIAYVAVENLTTTELKGSRVVLVFAFGLLHGMGFAGVLGELGLPRSEFVTALVTFNLGVEAGQLAVIALAFLGVAIWCRHAEWYRRRIVWPASAAMAAIGVYWTVTRLSI
jgi:hypothetical protein